MGVFPFFPFADGFFLLAIMRSPVAQGCAGERSHIVAVTLEGRRKGVISIAPTG
jgi:hypothetical protein